LSEIEEIHSFVGNYVEMKDFTTGEEIVRDYFDRKVDGTSNLRNWYEDENDDAFEDEVFDVVRDITDISLPNVRIEADVGDNPDFDVVVLPLGGFGQNYAIEVKDYLQEGNGNVDEKPAISMESGELRSELIRKPKDYAEQIDSNLISIVKGLSDEQYDNLQRLAEASNVALLNGENYEEELHDLLFEQRFRELSDYIH
jgi:hypothetical protein